jgi:hypothetical protein
MRGKFTTKVEQTNTKKEQNNYLTYKISYGAPSRLFEMRKKIADELAGLPLNGTQCLGYVFHTTSLCPSHQPSSIAMSEKLVNMLAGDRHSRPPIAF